jgi:hypothetical protein
MIKSIEEGRKEDGDRAIAKKILDRLHDLEKTIDNNQGRWAWELLQNAKDSIAEEQNRVVSVQIELDADTVEFRHDGKYFTEQDIRGLINQISSKEVEEGQQTTKIGRFGTGFLTTHLLSKVIEIEGVVKATDQSFYKFKFLLDRQATKTHQLIPKIKNSWQSFHDSTKKIDLDYDEKQFNTAFCYLLATEEQRKTARIGIEEFSKLAPFVLAFIPRIGKIEIIDRVSNVTTVFQIKRELIADFVIPVSKIENGEEREVLILYAASDTVSIATEIVLTESGYSVQRLTGLPKLFCDFPLVGTEEFHFPVMVNSFFFHPQTERDGIWLKGSDDLEVKSNQKILERAVELYGGLLSKITEGNFCNLYNFSETRIPAADIKYFDAQWYEEFIQGPIRKLIYDAKIVEIENEAHEKKAFSELWFPLKSFSKGVREKMWNFAFDLSSKAVCKRTHLHDWCDISWEKWQKIDYEVLVRSLDSRKDINTLAQLLGRTEENSFDWINSLGRFILEDDKNLVLFDKYAIVPNRNGEFRKRKDLHIDKVQDDKLIHILKLLGEDWKSILLSNSIDFMSDHVKERDKKDIAVKIIEKLDIESEKSSCEYNEGSIEAIRLLCEWFENNSSEAPHLFSRWYRDSAKLFMNTIQDKESLYRIMRSCPDLSELATAIEEDSNILKKIQAAKSIDNLLKEFDANSIADLESMLEVARSNLTDHSNKIEITQEILLSLGITSPQELADVLQDSAISSRFVHTSIPTLEMFLAVKVFIDRAKTNIRRHLESLPEYDCTDWEELATTIVGGVKKDGLSIHIVIRPSDNGEVIVYYDAEKATLDAPDVELWIENGIETPRRLTLGEVLKTIGVNKIPV